jgi:hypothetical protein
MFVTLLYLLSIASGWLPGLRHAAGGFNLEMGLRVSCQFEFPRPFSGQPPSTAN